jgi:hypothetical protein
MIKFSKVFVFKADGMTAMGVMLHPRFVGVRFDKSPREVVAG